MFLTAFWGNLVIKENAALTSLTGLDNVTFIGGSLWIEINNALTSLMGLGSVTSIGGVININGNNILTSLTGLDNVTSFGGYLYISFNAALTSLTGLDKITSIGEDLVIWKNTALTSLTGLDNVTSIGGDLRITENAALTSLTGLENIDASSINNLWIKHNNSLSICEILSICDYLASQNGTVEIYDNAPGCNSQEEVEAACSTISVEELITESSFSVYTNPSFIQITVETCTVPPPKTYLTIFNLNGQQLIERQITEPTTMVELVVLPCGIYVARLVWEKGIQVVKFVRE